MNAKVFSYNIGNCEFCLNKKVIFRLTHNEKNDYLLFKSPKDMVTRLERGGATVNITFNRLCWISVVSISLAYPSGIFFSCFEAHRPNTMWALTSSFRHFIICKQVDKSSSSNANTLFLFSCFFFFLLREGYQWGRHTLEHNHHQEHVKLPAEMADPGPLLHFLSPVTCQCPDCFWFSWG